MPGWPLVLGLLASTALLSAAGAAAAQSASQGASGPADGSAYSDLADAGLHEGAVRELLAGGVLDGTGCGGGRFCPGSAIKRWEVAVWLVRLLDGGVEPDSVAPRFADVDEGVWWAPHVQRLAELKVTRGCASDGRMFCPEDSVTRAQAASFLVRAYGLEPADSAGFADVEGVHAADIDALYAAGATKGCDTEPLRFCPRDATSRGEMATLMARIRALDSEVAAVPGPPRHLVVQSGFGELSNALRLRWSAPAADGGSPVTGYLIQYRLRGEEVWVTWSPKSPGAGSLEMSAIVGGLGSGAALVNAVPYQVRVAAINMNGIGEFAAGDGSPGCVASPEDPSRIRCLRSGRAARPA